jgi:hypothetical protein
MERGEPLFVGVDCETLFRDYIYLNKINRAQKGNRWWAVPSKHHPAMREWIAEEGNQNFKHGPAASGRTVRRSAAA